MKWYEIIGSTVILLVIMYIVLVPWMSIIDIHKSIDSLTDEIRKWREESKNAKN